jgi:hypothetical protein
LLIIMSCLLARTSLSVCTLSFHSTAISSCPHTALGMCEYQLYAVPMPSDHSRVGTLHQCFCST